MKLILASNSPRRREILINAGFTFTVIKSDYEEISSYFSAKKLVKTFAFNKAESVFKALSEEEKKSAVVLGADTVVCLKNEILGKPKTPETAAAMLKKLSGKTHFVLTGYAVITENSVKRGVVKSKVTFNELSDSLIADYVATGSPLDKAGAYGIQDGFPLVKRYKGSLNNVIGLPIEKLKPILVKALKD